MMMMFEWMLQEQCMMSEIAAVVERLVQRNKQFNEKDVSRYLRDYKAEMLRYGISERLQVISFKRASTGYNNKTRCGGPLKKLYERHMTTRDRRDEFDMSLNCG